MKSPLKKLRGFTFHKHEGKEKEHQKALKLDELVEAAKDMQDLKYFYDGILSAAASAANNTYELSEALKELGTCFLEKTALSDDENSGRALMMLGKAHFELQKLFSSYRGHIFQTMVKPSTSLLGELEILEEMKIQCDTKREAYKSMLMNHKGGPKSKNAKGEIVTSKELQAARDDYEEEVTLFVFRLKSLKQGQFRSLLTQATRHHAAQLSFFRKGLKALEAVEPHVKAVADQQHIEYQFSELQQDLDSDYDDDEDDDDDDDNYDGEISFDYKMNSQDQEVINVSRSFEEENTDKSQSSYNFSSRVGTGSQSAPIYADGKSDVSEKLKPLPSSSRKFLSYALPMPTAPISPSTNNTTGVATNDKWWFSSPLEAKNPTKDINESERLSSSNSQTASPLTKGGSGPIPLNAYSVLSEERSFLQLNPVATSDAKSSKRQAFSGPLKNKPYDSGPRYSVGDYETPSKVTPVVSKAAPRHASQNPLSVSPPKHRSSPPISTPRISELHELPRPPVNPGKAIAPSGLVGYSGPLISRGQVTAKNKLSPLPVPPGPMTRSFSIPTRGERMSVHSIEAHSNSATIEEVTSPALMPLSSTIANKISVMGEIK